MDVLLKSYSKWLRNWFANVSFRMQVPNGIQQAFLTVDLLASLGQQHILWL
jgi:hypothetical protein